MSEVNTIHCLALVLVWDIILGFLSFINVMVLLFKNVLYDLISSFVAFYFRVNLRSVHELQRKQTASFSIKPQSFLSSHTFELITLIPSRSKKNKKQGPRVASSTQLRTSLITDFSAIQNN